MDYKKKNINIGLICYETQRKQLISLIESDNFSCKIIITENMRFIKKLFSVIKMIICCDLIYLGHGYSYETKDLKILKMFKKKFIMHWIGSDVLMANDMLESTLEIQKYITKNLACSQLISDELQELKIKSDVVPIVPSNIKTKIAKVPKKHAVITYLPNGKEDFYGIDYISAAAKKYKDVEFNIVGNDNDTLNMSNVHFLGKLNISQMDKLYDDSSVLIRLPKHDGLSLMLLEALMKGKEVIYCYEFPYCKKANTTKELFSHLDAIFKEKPKLNENGRNYVLDKYEIKNIKGDLKQKIISCLEAENGK